MTVTVNVRARFQPFRGSDDPSLPTGYWHASPRVTGDASGGSQIAQVSLVRIDQADDSLWSLEALSAFYTRTTGQSAHIRVPNADNPNVPGQPHSLAFTTNLVQGANLGMIEGRDLAFLPLYIGKRAFPLAAALFLEFETFNINTETLDVTMYGYQWSARSLDTPTGPRRPLGSVFGA